MIEVLKWPKVIHDRNGYFAKFQWSNDVAAPAPKTTFGT
jgi:hypothetical protein